MEKRPYKVNNGRLVETFLSLAALDSPSFDERPVADEILARLRALGLDPQEDGAGAIIGGTAGNIFVRVPESPACVRPARLFTAHMDTVPPCKGKKLLVGETITSDGTTILGADDLAAVAGLLEALTVIFERGLEHGPLELLFTPAEEVYSRGIKAFDFDRVTAKMAFTPDYDGPLGACVNRAPSILSFCAKMVGKASHAGFSPEKGVSAVAAAARAIAGLRLGRIDSETTANVGLISGGNATNIVPEECWVRGEVRSYSHEKALSQISEIRAAFENAGCCVFECEVCLRAYETPEASGAGALYRQVCQSLGILPRFDASFGGSDNNTLALQGIAGIVLASAMHGCHTTAEYTRESELNQLAQLLIGLMTG